MKATALQQFVKQVFSSEQQRASFQADPAGFVSHFDLSTEEKRAILSTSDRICVNGTDTAAMTTGIEPAFVWD